ncbi:hypothetical protein GCM10027160_39260 [Streptomyces calidiresistens]
MTGAVPGFSVFPPPFSVTRAAVGASRPGRRSGAGTPGRDRDGPARTMPPTVAGCTRERSPRMRLREFEG